MNGLIVKSPWAQQIVSGKKNKEYRSNQLPRHYLNIPVYILSTGHIHGIVKFINSRETTDGYVWEIVLIKSFKTPRRYLHPNGAQVWVKDVDVIQTTLS